MRERAVYLGDGTAAATILRNEHVSAGLQGTPMQWFSTVVAALLGKSIDVTPPALSHAKGFSRGLLAGLGYDPDTHELGRRQGCNSAHAWRRESVLIVRDAAGRPVRYVTGKQLKKLEDDPEFLRAFGEETGGRHGRIEAE